MEMDELKTKLQRKGTDELKINLHNGILSKCVTKLIKATIFKKFGIDVKIELNELSIINYGEHVHIHVDMDGETTMDNFNSLTKNLL